MSRVELEREQVLAEPNERSEILYFPEGGLISSLVWDQSASTEVGLIGHEGMTGLSAALGDERVPIQAVMQVERTGALAIEVDAFREQMERNVFLRSLVLRYASCFLVQLSYALLSCRKHFMEARLARWLLMCHDRVEGDEIPLTHETIASMLSVQRTGVTMSLHSLEGDGMIRSSRGLVTIRDRVALRALAGQGYGPPEQRYSELIAPFGK